MAGARTLGWLFFSMAKFLLIVGGIVLAIKVFAFPDYVHRYRLAIEVDTPDGLKRAANIIEVKRKDVRFTSMGKYSFDVHGEAVFLDLGNGRNVIALLAHGPRALPGAIRSIG
jgi:hypothetical protein